LVQRHHTTAGGQFVTELTDKDRALMTRKETSVRLNCSIATLRRLEQRGVLTAVSLRRDTTGKKYYRPEQVQLIIMGVPRKPPGKAASAAAKRPSQKGCRGVK
jgi:hypothetical protein